MEEEIGDRLFNFTNSNQQIWALFFCRNAALGKLIYILFSRQEKNKVVIAWILQ
jgi:hypothetical protein